MTFSIRLSSAAFAIAALLAGAGIDDARAAPFTAIDFSSVPGPNATPLSLTGFDIAGRDLIEARFSIDSLKEIRAGVEAQFSNDTDILVRAQVSGHLKVFLTVGTTRLMLFEDSVTARESGCLARAGCITTIETTFGGPFRPGPASVTDPAILAALTGPSATVDLSIEVEGILDYCNIPAAAVISCRALGEPRWEGDLTVAFVSVPSDPSPSVPEPATFALVGAGLSALAGLRRKAA